ncbi:MAG: glutathione S-transferase N-terminal domain-containing protein [Mariprofundales bacterium]|nr:glutathione S-transferase N-terminal domain-containing protein [Mariprofundales bacterium]
MITLYSNPRCADSHKTRIVLAEKELPVTTIDLDDMDKLPKEFLKLNPYGKLPTVIDRDIVFFEPTIVNEYLDERYPHPPLKPGSPAERAKMRLAVKHIEDEIYPLYFNWERVKKKSEPMKKIRVYLDSLNSYLENVTWFVSDQYTLADITLAPALFRLRNMAHSVDMHQWKHLCNYSDRLFDRPAFAHSLSDYEENL